MKKDDIQKGEIFLQKIEVEKEQILKIPKRLLRAQFLLYRLIEKEFKIVQTCIQLNSNHLQIIKELKELKSAYLEFIQLDLYLNAKDTYSRHSVGLDQLFMRSVYNTKTEINSNSKSNLDLSISLVSVGKKMGGVEPGFQAKLKQDIYLYIYEIFPDDDKRWDFIIEMKGDFKNAFARYESKSASYLIKNTYTEVNGTTVTSKTDDLKRSHVIKKVGEILGSTAQDLALWGYQIHKKIDISQLNYNAVLEVYANNMLIAAGIKTQDQSLVIGNLPNGSLLLLMAGKWIEFATELGGKDGDRLRGDNSSNKYRVTPFILPGFLITHCSDNSIEKILQKLTLRLFG